MSRSNGTNGARTNAFRLVTCGGVQPSTARREERLGFTQESGSAPSCVERGDSARDSGSFARRVAATGGETGERSGDGVFSGPGAGHTPSNSRERHAAPGRKAGEELRRLGYEPQVQTGFVCAESVNCATVNNVLALQRPDGPPTKTSIHEGGLANPDPRASGCVVGLSDGRTDLLPCRSWPRMRIDGYFEGVISVTGRSQWASKISNRRCSSRL
jgi:hypothetical protein